MAAEALTQAEIDALLTGGAVSESETEAEPASPGMSMITAEEEEGARHYADVVGSSAGSVLSTLLGDEVSVSVQEIMETDPTTVGEQIPGKVIAATLNYKGLVHGQTLFNMGYDEAVQLAGQMTGGGDITTVGDLEESALGEAIQQIMSTANTEFSSRLGSEIDIDPPEITTDPDDLAQLLPPSDQREILVTYKIESASLSGTFTQVIPRNLVHSLMEASTEPEKAAAAISDQRDYATSAKTPEVLEQPATFQPLISDEPKFDFPNLELILDIPLEIRVELGRSARKIREVLELGPGSVVELDKQAGEPVDILVNNKLFARGEVVVIDENFGVRITDILSIEERIEALK